MQAICQIILLGLSMIIHSCFKASSICMPFIMKSDRCNKRLLIMLEKTEFQFKLALLPCMYRTIVVLPLCFCLPIILLCEHALSCFVIFLRLIEEHGHFQLDQEFFRERHCYYRLILKLSAILLQVTFTILWLDSCLV